MIRRKKVSAKKTIERIFTPGDASKYITHDGIQQGDQVVLYCRVSTRQQNHNGNLDAQEQYLRNQMGKRDAKVVHVVRYVGSGFEPLRLPLAVRFAKQHGAKIVALSTDRFIRHESFKSTGSKKARKLRVNTRGLEDLREIAKGVELVTLLDPNASLEDCIKLQSEIGQQAKFNKGGRPLKRKPGYKKQRRLKFLEKVIQLQEQGKSIRDIEKELKIPSSTVHSWVSSFFNGD
ncbi:recombinase family protein [Gimesia chilikensis]|uniref:Resolvase/invertase-type recombinase catalytic domain-containing protein n=1 Tax=Gimesia chilikensis TaxID=2605989 RepID=A0A517PG37_9PLAN|nr:recombinase family protein [Gimesia chilikensis]QDT18325.1 hypothetical protein HG66A1_00840 [Gimesia chilikensis]